MNVDSKKIKVVQLDVIRYNAFRTQFMANDSRCWRFVQYFQTYFGFQFDSNNWDA